MKHRPFQFVLFCTAITIFVSSNFSSAFQGDINDDCELNLQDVILGLQVVSGIAPTISPIISEIDVNGDGRIGQAEIIYVLQVLQNNYVGSACRIWMDRNLGAFRVAVSSTDPEAFGDLYQWGRLADGHESRDDNSTTTVLSDSDDPGHGDFILVADSPFDWRDPQNDDLWQGVPGTNNPCPSGFRLPTATELNTERESWDTNDSAGAFGSPLKLVMAGSRSLDGTTLGQESFGFYWSNIAVGSSSSSLLFFSTDARMSINGRVNGYSVRCIMD